MTDAQRLKRHYELLLEEGRKLAGGLGDLAQRANTFFAGSAQHFAAMRHDVLAA